MSRNGDWIQTYTGRKFWPLDPRAEDVDIEDIAHSLANQCRFTGHCREFYSVCNHSILVARHLPEDLQLHGLLHDATEAYLVDLAGPIKQFFPQFVEAEARIWRAIADRFDLPYDEPKEVKEHDNRALVTEFRDLMFGDIDSVYEPYEDRIEPLPSRYCKATFLRMFRELGVKL